MQSKRLDWQPANRQQQTIQAKKLFGVLLKARCLSPVTICIYENVIHKIGEKLDLLAWVHFPTTNMAHQILAFSNPG